MSGRGSSGGREPGPGHGVKGLTLLELMLVLTMIGVLTCLAAWGGSHLSRGWQLRRAGHQLLEDLKAVQARAEMSANMTVSNGTLTMHRAFLVFDPAAQSYAAYTWQDHNGNAVAEPGESTPLWQKGLPPGVSFRWAPGIDRRACSNVNGSPGDAISFSSPNYAPCNDRPCIKFDQHGFSAMGPGAVYLSEGQQTLAISGTRAGHFTMCEWGGERWK